MPVETKRRKIDRDRRGRQNSKFIPIAACFERPPCFSPGLRIFIDTKKWYSLCI